MVAISQKIDSKAAVGLDNGLAPNRPQVII